MRFHSSPRRKPLSTCRAAVAEILAALYTMGHAYRGITKERYRRRRHLRRRHNHPLCLHA